MNILRNTRRILTVVLVAGALSAPVAAAAPFEQLHPSSGDQSDGSIVPPAGVSDASTAPYVGTAPAAESPSAGPASELPTPDTYLGQSGITLPAGDDVVASSSPVSVDDGFNWGDASIGAAAVLAIMAIGAGVVLEVSRRRRPRPTVA